MVAVPVRTCLFLADQPEVGLVDQGGRLERQPPLLLGQFRCRELAQLVVDQRQELLGSVEVALLDGRQDACNFTHGSEDTRCGVTLQERGVSWVQTQSRGSNNSLAPFFRTGVYYPNEVFDFPQVVPRTGRPLMLDVRLACPRCARRLKTTEPPAVGQRFR